MCLRPEINFTDALDFLYTQKEHRHSVNMMRQMSIAPVSQYGILDVEGAVVVWWRNSGPDP